MGKGKQLILLVGISAVFLVEGLLLLTWLIVRSFWNSVITLGTIALTIYFFYVRLCQKKEARYPMVPPEGKTDIYFPRTNIPRPVHADFRRIEEKRRRLAKLKKTKRKEKRVD